MSTLSKQNQRFAKDLAEAMAEVIKEALVSAAFIKALEEKGRPLMDEAKLKLADMQISPDLPVALEKVLPKDAYGGFKFGVEFLRESDQLWDAIVTKILGKNPFTKRGMSAYFMHYIGAMIKLDQMVSRDKELEMVLANRKDNLGAILLGAKAKSLIEEGYGICSTLFGYTAILNEQIPAKPDTFRKRIGVYAWTKMARGAVASDYEEVRKVADEFLAGSMKNPRIAQLAYL